MSLPSSGLLKVSGGDAKKLLQGQLTCQMEDVSPLQSRLGAYCNPQGRVISLFRIFQFANDYYLYMPQSLVPITLAALKKYAVFFKVALTDATQDLPNLASAITLEPYADVYAGIPAIYPETSGLFLPHDLNLPALQAVSFEKGCYTGQEIIARMEFRGKPKKHLYAATLKNISPIKPGADIYSTQDKSRVVGNIVDTMQNENICHILFVTDEENAKDAHLFLPENPENYFIIKNQETRKNS